MKTNGDLPEELAFVFVGQSQLGVVSAPALKSLYFADVSENEAFKVSSTADNLSINNGKKKSVFIILEEILY